MSNEDKKSWWAMLKRPSARYSMGTLLVVGIASGIILWGGFNTAMEATNNEQFCISCHEMKENVYMEYQNTIHYNNRTGVRATCPDCHVPMEWTHKIVRKIQASNELLHKALGTIDTPEKFEAKRLELARHVWASMKKTDSRECRNCHDYESMDYTKQGRRGRAQHVEGFDQGKTCIDCHKGIAHSLPAMYEEDPSAALGGPK
ncbi:MAG: cytochrome c-type protein NapC [Gammaproteobacteria bacterium HGW-Gammaproteobacteria-1]|jgi:nitrate/nitrite reductase NapC/NirT family c-type cytochrome|nr:MAG: cytochrome c-type protein NapC [Gammaproteobacteria bacterium HGW-Gammaproteobacteria-1]